MSKVFVLVLALGVMLVGGGWWYWNTHYSLTSSAVQQDVTEPEPQSERTEPPAQPGAAIGDENMVVFSCDQGKTMTAVFERDIVGLTLSDGRQIVLRQAPTASGVRYLSNDTRIELASKGEGADLREEGEVSYANCVAGE